MSRREVREVNNDWRLWAREHQQLPPGGEDWRTWLLLGGRGAGKTRAGAEWVRARALGLWPATGPRAERIAIVAPTFDEARIVMIEGKSGLLAIHPDDERPDFAPSRRQLTWPNGAIAQIFSAEEPEGLRGPQFDAAWCDELAKWRQAEACWHMLAFALRLAHDLDQIDAMSADREALWARLERASFLTVDEKRAAVGYGPKTS